MSRRARFALLAACACVAGVLALVPDPERAPLGRVASIDGDGPDPLYDAPLDGEAIRRAGEIVPGGATYAVFAPGASPLVQGNLKAAAQLFLAPALPVQDQTEADWLLVYGTGIRIPGGARLQPLGPNLALVRQTR